MRRLLRRSLALLLIIAAAYVMVLAYPQPLFAHEMGQGRLTLHSTQPMPPAIAATLDRAHARLRRSSLFAAAGAVHVFLCHETPVFALFARQNYRVGGVADGLVAQHVFLRESDMERDRLISPTGTPVAADRPLSYFIAHEVTHIAIARHVGRVRYSRLPQWLDDGYADYVARDIDYSEALRQFKQGARELDPRRSGLYLRYHLMVAFLLEKRGMAIETLLATPPQRETVERELLVLDRW